jgi:diguanylate cyclase (GGDEF)-like protein
MRRRLPSRERTFVASPHPLGDERATSVAEFSLRRRTTGLVGSFKLKLVAYFVLLSLVPLAGVTWAFSAAAGQNELQQADESLRKSLGAASGSITREFEVAAGEAEALARSPQIQVALRESDRATLAEFAEAVPGASFSADGVLLAGSVPSLAASRTANVVDEAETIGVVRVAVALDDPFLDEIAGRSGLRQDESLAMASDGSVVAGPEALAGQAVPPVGEDPDDVTIGDTAYRAVAALVPADGGNVVLLAMTPRSSIASELGDVNLRLLLAALGSVAVVAAVAFLPGRAIVGALRDLAGAARAIAEGRLSQRVPVRGRDEFAQLGQAFNDMASQLESRHAELTAERQRVDRALDRLGDALAAGNEPEPLLLVVAESAVEATGAVGARILRGGETVVRAGDPSAGGDPATIPLGTGEGGEVEMLLLYPAPGTGFGQDALGAAHSLATQASIALENARLHRILARQAVTDDLTQLANRRRFEEALEHEVSRVRRFGGGLSLILADLDDFKAINDRFGHQLGDDVLRAFADVVRKTVRAVDIPARPGGEEFAVILPGTDLGEATLVAERLRAQLAGRRIAAPREQLAVTVSLGVAAYDETMSTGDLFGVADQALYEAKAGGKNRVVARRRGPVAQEATTNL